MRGGRGQFAHLPDGLELSDTYPPANNLLANDKQRTPACQAGMLLLLLYMVLWMSSGVVYSVAYKRISSEGVMFLTTLQYLVGACVLVVVGASCGHGLSPLRELLWQTETNVVVQKTAEAPVTLARAEDAEPSAGVRASFNWKMVVSALLFLSGTLFTNASLYYLPVGLAHVIKACEPLVMMGILRIRGEKLELTVTLAALCIVCGVLFTVMVQDASVVSPVGLICGFASNVCYQTRNILNKDLMQKHAAASNRGSLVRPFHLLAATFCIGLPVQLLVYAVSNGVSSAHAAEAAGSSNLNLLDFAWLCLTPLAFLSYHFFSIYVLGLVHPLFHAIANTMKRVTIIGFGGLLTGEVMKADYIFGIIVTLVGVFCYSISKKIRPSALVLIRGQRLSIQRVIQLCLIGFIVATSVREYIKLHQQGAVAQQRTLLLVLLLVIVLTLVAGLSSPSSQGTHKRQFKWGLVTGVAAGGLGPVLLLLLSSFFWRHVPAVSNGPAISNASGIQGEGMFSTNASAVTPPMPCGGRGEGASGCGTDSAAGGRGDGRGEGGGADGGGGGSNSGGSSGGSPLPLPLPSLKPPEPSPNDISASEKGSVSPQPPSPNPPSPNPPSHHPQHHPLRTLAPKVVLHGACGRHNFGDMLMPHIAIELMARRGIAQSSFLVTDIAARDLTMYGGHNVRGILDVLASEDSLGGLVVAGGEVGGCSFALAMHMFFHLEDEDVHTQHVHDAAQAAFRQKYMQDGREHWKAYLPSRSHLPDHLKSTKLIANAIGQTPESNVRDYAFVSFRDQQWASMDHEVVPDSVILIRRLMDHKISPLDLQLHFSGQYIAVQFKASLFRQNRLLFLMDLCRSLGEMARELSAGLVFFRAGAAWHHDSLYSYREMQASMNAKFSDVHTQVFEELDIFKIVALISKAKALVSTSLHTRIIASAYHVRRLTLHPDQKHIGWISKWDPLKTSSIVHNFARDWRRYWRTMNVPDEALDMGAIEERYYALFKRYAHILGVDTCPAHLAPAS